MNQITYEVRRDKAVVTTKTDSDTAFAYARANSFAPGQLQVYRCEKSETLLSDEPLRLVGASGYRAGHRGRG